MQPYRIREHLGEIVSIMIALAPIVIAIVIKAIGAV